MHHNYPVNWEENSELGVVRLETSYFQFKISNSLEIPGPKKREFELEGRNLVPTCYYVTGLG